MKILFLGIVIYAVIASSYHYFTTVQVVNGRPTQRWAQLFVRQSLAHPLVVVPGIKASLLRRREQVVWVRLLDVFHNTPPLVYTEGDGVVAYDLLTRISFLPGLLSYRPFQRLMQRLAQYENTYVFVYDWRKQPDELSREFGEFVERVRKQTGSNPVVVAHSMGGLIAHGYIKEHQDHVAKVVYASVPFRPGSGYFSDVHTGVATGRNKSILSKEALFSHPASYLLMPHRGSGYLPQYELFNATEWQRNKWSVFADREVDLDAFQATLDRVAAYHARLDAPAVFAIPTLIIAGKGIPVIHDRYLDGKLVKEDGDGRVLYPSAFPYDRLVHLTEQTFAVRHDVQMDNRAIVDAIMQFVQ